MTHRAKKQFFCTDIQVCVLEPCVFGLMIVAAVAGVLVIDSRVAGFAGNFALLAMVEREIMLVQKGRRPRCGRMAVMAGQAEEVFVDIRLGVASDAQVRRALKLEIDMASGTLAFGMFTVQNKKFRVIKIVHSVDAVVAAGALRSHHLGVIRHKYGILFGVAGDAVGRRSRLHTVDVAISAGERVSAEIGDVAHQFEIRFRVFEKLVVDHCGRPACRRVAGSAVGAEKAQVYLRCGMAVNA